MREHEKEFAERNVKVVVVTFEQGFLARSYVEESALAWPLLVDESRETYRNYGMLAASTWDIWGPKSWWAYLKALSRGEKLRKSDGDVYQRGGDVIVDPEGIVALHHVGNGPADRPGVELLLRTIRRA